MRSAAILIKMNMLGYQTVFYRYCFTESAYLLILSRHFVRKIGAVFWFLGSWCYANIVLAAVYNCDMQTVFHCFWVAVCFCACSLVFYGLVLPVCRGIGDISHRWLVYFAIEKNDLRRLKRLAALLPEYPEIISSEIGIEHAIECNRLEIVRYFLDFPGVLDTKLPLLSLAVEKGNLELVQLLVDTGGKRFPRDTKHCFIALKRHDLQMFRYFIEEREYQLHSLDPLFLLADIAKSEAATSKDFALYCAAVLYGVNCSDDESVSEIIETCQDVETDIDRPGRIRPTFIRLLKKEKIDSDRWPDLIRKYCFHPHSIRLLETLPDLSFAALKESMEDFSQHGSLPVRSKYI